MAPKAGERTVTILMATYNDWTCVAHLLPRIDAELSRMGRRGEVVVVDDGSVDLAGRDQVAALRLGSIDRVRSVTLTRNMGNQRALAIGIAHLGATGCGDHVILMDSDHEDDPTYIPALIQACEDEGDRKVIFAERTKRSEGRVFRVFYGLFQKLYQLLTGQRIDVGNYSVIPGAMVRRISTIAELWSHYPAAIMRARVPFGRIPSTRSTRFAGKSSMSLVPLVVHALSGFSVHAETIGARTLLAAGGLGLAILGGLALVVGLKLFTDLPIIGWTSQFGALLLILLFQLMIAAFIMVFIVVSVRMQVPFIPAREFATFVDQVEELLGAPAHQGEPA